jgi:hypothetical protein
MMTKPRIFGGPKVGPPMTFGMPIRWTNDVEGALSLSSCAACQASRFRDEPLAYL